MTEIPLPQEPDSQRQVVRSIDADGNLVFSQVGFQELDFGAIFGGKTTSGSENTIGYGTKTFTLDSDDGKILAGHTVQIISLADEDCFMYGLVLKKDTVNEPARITVAIHTISDPSITSSDWEIQIVEVSRDTTLEAGDADLTLEDQHKVVFYTSPLTANRTLDLPPGTTLVPGTRLLVTDASENGAFSDVNRLLIQWNGMDYGQLDLRWSSREYVWAGSAWVSSDYMGYLSTTTANSCPLFMEEVDNSNIAGPLLSLHKQSASPAVSDNIGLLAFSGNNNTGDFVTYALIGGYIGDPTNGSEDGGMYLTPIIAGGWPADAPLAIQDGVFCGAPTGGPQGIGTLNATGLFVNGVSVTAAASTTASGQVELATSAETITGTDATRAVTPAGLKARIDNGISIPAQLFSTSPSAGIGYAAGAGGTVTQLTSKATAVTLNTMTGLITMNGAALAANAEVQFTLNNTRIDGSDTVIVNHRNTGTFGAYLVQAGATVAGSCNISVRNLTGGSLSQAIGIRFTIIKSVST